MVDQAFRDAAYPQETGEALVTLLTIEHAELAGPILLTDSGTDVVYGADLLDANGNVAAKAGTYVAFPIEIIPPGQSDEEVRGTLRIPNVDQAIGAALEAITDPAMVTITVVLASDTSIIVAGPHLMLELSNVRGDAMAIEADVTRPSLTVQPYPKHWLRPATFRAAFRL